MRPETLKLLYDAKQAADLITQFSSGKSLEDYSADPMLSSAIQRQFEIVGEAFSQLAKTDAQVAARITQYKRIIAFLNVLIHGYSTIVDAIVWDVVQGDVPVLSQQLAGLLNADESG